MSMVFSGSYDPGDVIFLLKRIEMPCTGIQEKEYLIQSGRKHYSEMISRENPPSRAYLDLFKQACRMNGERFCADLIRLARNIDERFPGEMTIVSLARAGTPVGVLLKRLLERHMGRECRHYSISIIRDRGIDENALRHILEHDKRKEDGIVFVDGWTGKGVISAELRRWVEDFNLRNGRSLSSQLYVVADISGTATCSATYEDYLIPSAIMNSIVSGLVSRSILNKDFIGRHDFHGCLYYEEFEGIDLSRSFVDEIMGFAPKVLERAYDESIYITPRTEKNELRRRSKTFLGSLKTRFRINTINHIKPGIGEATRVLLRREPKLLLVRNGRMPEVAHLIQLAREKNVPVEQDENLPYNAAAIIAEID